MASMVAMPGVEAGLADALILGLMGTVHNLVDVLRPTVQELFPLFMMFLDVFGALRNHRFETEWFVPEIRNVIAPLGGGSKSWLAHQVQVLESPKVATHLCFARLLGDWTIKWSKCENPVHPSILFVLNIYAMSISTVASYHFVILDTRWHKRKFDAHLKSYDPCRL